MIKYTVLFPIQYNDGRWVENRIIWDFEAEVTKIVGGISRRGFFKPNAKIYGKWTEPGSEILYQDQSLEFFIAMETEEQLEQVETVVQKYMKKLGQHCYYREIDRNADITIVPVEY